MVFVEWHFPVFKLGFPHHLKFEVCSFFSLTLGKLFPVSLEIDKIPAAKLERVYFCIKEELLVLRTQCKEPIAVNSDHSVFLYQGPALLNPDIDKFSLSLDLF